MDLAYLGTIVLLILGFGFVVFWHELGHFIAAKWAGVKVEQFAVGFGQAICSWRQGMGLRWGSSGKEYEQMLRSDFAGAKVGETEYRLNWLPLGGYVKMLGQDDLRPGVAVDDPRAYNNKSIGARMVIVSAGVVMNVILAAALFMILFLIGFKAPPAIVGSIQIGSPAQKTVRPDGAPAPLQVGDKILYFDNKYQHDFTKITLAVALAGAGRTPMYVERADGTHEHLLVTPTHAPGEPSGFVMLGVGPSYELRGPELTERELKELSPQMKQLLDDAPVRPGETVVKVAGQDVGVKEFWKLDHALQQSFGKPVPITVRDKSGVEQRREVRPNFGSPFGDIPLHVAGMAPRVIVETILEKSAASGKLQPGDVILSVTINQQGDTVATPTIPALIKLLDEAGRSGRAVDVTVLRGGQEQTVKDLAANYKNEQTRRRGLGIGLKYDVERMVIAEVVKDTPAAEAGVVRGATIDAVDGQPVSTWFELHRALAQRSDGAPAPRLTVTTPHGEQRTVDLNLDADDRAALAQIRYVGEDLALADRIEPRKTSNPLVAAAWGAADTRDLIIQFYLTLQRMAEGRVSPTNLMGPIGIVSAGSRIAYKGHDWLLWFLAMISANLAVVNFLPIPIVDGGLFVFLILEKIMGRPLSPRAQSVAQIVGLALILSVFLFVTYQDITRFF